MKALVISIYDPNPNYGNRLQNYAVCEVIKKFNIDTQSVFFEKEAINYKYFVKFIIQLLTGFNLPGNSNFWHYEFPRRLVFRKFNRKYIPTMKIKHLCQISHSDADFFILGSDQVWNAEWYANTFMKKEMYLLTFANPDQKVCFAPSFGVEKLPKEWEWWFKKWLPTFSRVSVREEAGVNIIRNLTGQDAEVLIDPTLMLNQSDWLKIANKPKNVELNESYILTYFLGGYTKQVDKDIRKISQKYRLKVYNLLDFNQPHIYVTGPSEFIYLIANAKLILTDSYHACIFSFLFKKPFLVYQREGNNNMISRIETLLKKFDIQRKYVDSGLPNGLFECDYMRGYQQLDVERKKVIDFLKESMNIE